MLPFLCLISLVIFILSFKIDKSHTLCRLSMNHKSGSYLDWKRWVLDWVALAEVSLSNNWTIRDEILSALRDAIFELIDNTLMIASLEYPFTRFRLKFNFNFVFIYFGRTKVFLLVADDRTVTNDFIDFEGLGEKIILEGWSKKAWNKYNFFSINLNKERTIIRDGQSAKRVRNWVLQQVFVHPTRWRWNFWSG